MVWANEDATHYQGKPGVLLQERDRPVQCAWSPPRVVLAKGDVRRTSRLHAHIACRGSRITSKADPPHLGQCARYSVGAPIRGGVVDEDDIHRGTQGRQVAQTIERLVPSIAADDHHRDRQAVQGHGTDDLTASSPCPTSCTASS